ncbi:MAG: cell division protein SepF [Candidatus Hadarchaeota archaeon]
MRTIKKLFTKPGQSPEIAEEVPIMEVEPSGASFCRDIEPVYVKSIELQGPTSIQDATEELQHGNIVIIDLGLLLNQNPADAKHAVDQLKAFSLKIGGDVGRLTDSKIIATPKLVKLQFKKQT